MNRLKNGLEKQASALLLLFLAVQPVLDVASYFLLQRGSSALTTALRFGLLFVMALLGFLLTESKKSYLLCYGAAGVFWLAHLLNCLRTGYQSPMEDAANFLRILSLPIYTLALISFLQQGERVRRGLYRGFFCAFLLIVLFTALPWLLGQPVYTYESLGLGVAGWFEVANAQSAILTLTVPLFVFQAYRTGRYGIFVGSVVLAAALLYLTGTKLTFFAIPIIFGGYFVLFLLQQGKKALRWALPCAGVSVAAVLLLSLSPMAVREGMSRYAEKYDYGQRVENALASSAVSVGLEAEVALLSASAPAPAQTGDKNDASALVRIYTEEAVYGKQLKDMNARFGVDKVMDAYGYTSDPAVLSNSRLRKQIYARLVWQEQNAVTRLLGFEYREMIAGTTNYDLENDFPAVFYFFGYAGFALYLLFFAAVAVRAVWVRLQVVGGAERELSGKGGLARFRRFLSLDTGVVGITAVLGLAAAQMSGNVLRRPNVTPYLAAALACLWVMSRETEEKSEF